jgi:hypothetical protein
MHVRRQRIDAWLGELGENKPNALKAKNGGHKRIRNSEAGE